MTEGRKLCSHTFAFFLCCKKFNVCYNNNYYTVGVDIAGLQVHFDSPKYWGRNHLKETASLMQRTALTQLNHIHGNDFNNLAVLNSDLTLSLVFFIGK